MKEEHNNNALKKLLNRLQEESWQLELLVSGFTIFGLFNARGPVGDAFQEAILDGSMLKDLYQTVYAAILILIFNLIIHVILRSLWIGALGLRSVSGELEIDRLKYAHVFTEYLKRKIGSFDSYIEKLEKLCSIIFAISFLLIFYVAAAFIVLHVINIIASFISNDSSLLLTVPLYVLKVLFIVGAVLTFIDYLSQGLLKKNRWVAKVYFPFYRVFTFLTLSFLYRSLYYNLIDNKFGRQISAVLLPFYLLVLILANSYKEPSAYIALSSVGSSNIIANSRNYEDQLDKVFNISTLAIQSKVICDPYIKIKVPITKMLEERILEFNKSLKPFRDNNGYSSLLQFGSSFPTFNVDSLHQEYLSSFNRMYSIKIDTIEYDSEFIIAKEDGRLSFQTYIGTGKLADGKHVLNYLRYKHAQTDSMYTVKKIPFWYYKD